NDSIIQPSVSILFPILLWQSQQNCPDANGIDCDQTNPSVDGEALILKRLILPPGAVQSDTP
ncbi:MAG TPA: hypothetical protein VEZ90_18630, partial [Blastocatellia bacterium]|nr:hypothetical protein [Blastocatellia bacterium]